MRYHIPISVGFQIGGVSGGFEVHSVEDGVGERVARRQHYVPRRGRNFVEVVERFPIRRTFIFYMNICRTGGIMKLFLWLLKLMLVTEALGKLRLLIA